MTKIGAESKNIENVNETLDKNISILNGHLLRLCDVVDSVKNSINMLKDSNIEISKANEKYSCSLAWYTGALVFVGLLQALILHMSK